MQSNLHLLLPSILAFFLFFIVDTLNFKPKRLSFLYKFLLMGAIVLDSVLSAYQQPIKLLSLVCLLFVLLGCGDSFHTKSKGTYYGLFTALLGIDLVFHAQLFIEVLLSLELLSLSIYMLMANTNEVKKQPDTLKTYVIWSALTTSLFIFAWGWLYAYTGFYSFSQKISLDLFPNKIIAVCLLLLLYSSFIFKLMIVPFHFWGFKVFEHSSKTVLSFLATIPKFALAVLLLAFLKSLDFELLNLSKTLFSVLGMATAILGMIGLTKVKSFNNLVFNSILTGGGFLVLSIFNSLSDTSNLFIYLFASGISILAILLLPQGTKQEFTSTPKRSLSSLLLKSYFLIVILSIAGLPPTLGFWGKYIVLLTSFKIGNNNIYFTVLGIISICAIVFLFYAWLKKLTYFWKMIDAGKTKANIVEKVLFVVFSLLIILGVFIF